MIISLDVIPQPYSGEYKERIYDISSLWNSQNWTWVKFINDDYTEWCGEFRGEPKAVASSPNYHFILILTSDYLYEIDSLNGNLISFESQPKYQNMTVTPIGDILISDYYGI